MPVQKRLHFKVRTLPEDAGGTFSGEKHTVSNQRVLPLFGNNSVGKPYYQKNCNPVVPKGIVSVYSFL